MVRRRESRITEEGKEQLKGTEKQKGVPEENKYHMSVTLWFPAKGRRNRSLIRRQSRWPWRKETTTSAKRKSQGSPMIEVLVWVLGRQ